VYQEETMSYQEGLSQWKQELSSHFPALSRPQVRILAIWSFALFAVQQVGMTRLCYWLTMTIGGRPGTWRQSLREWCYDAGEKKGMQRQELDVSACFAPLLAWVLQWWSPTQDKRLLLALDETPLGDRFHVLTISVLYRQCAIPVAWQVRGSRERGAWEPLWERLLSQLKPVVPQEWEVLVFADRGISGASLFRHIVSLQWHPFLRLTQRGSVRVQGREEYQPIKQLLSEQGVGWCGRVSCFASVQLRCTLLTGQGKGQKEPWVVITDLPAEQAQLAWYQMRYWIECGFKDLKSGGWKWQHSKIKQAHRMQRYLLVMAVSTLWEMSQAQSAQEALPVTKVQDLPPTHVARRRATGRQVPRELSCLSLGTLWVLRMAVLGQWQMQGRFVAFEWPQELPEATRKPPKKRHQPAKGGKKRWRMRRRLEQKQVA
jgi:hypothetical protein